jgi:hypothetical protein
VDHQVTITGSGFAPGAVAAWERNGIADTKITVVSTQYVSSSTLIATIDIAADADISLYDVSVTLLDRKKGIGTMMFEVTTAEVLGTLGGDSYVNDMDDLGGITGYCSGGSQACTGAFYYLDGVGMLGIGSGQGWGTDPQGTMVLGRDASFKATAWVKQGDGSYVAEYLPNPGTAGGNVQTGARTAAGTLIVGGNDIRRVSRNSTVNEPAVWTRSGSSWTGPVLYVHPGTSSTIRDLNGNGQAVGVVDGGGGIVWEDPTTYATLDGQPWSINDAGTVIVGERNQQPVFWVRNATTGTWISAPTVLPSLSGTSCSARANDVNNGGVIVGSSCNGKKRQATVWHLDMSGATPVLTGTAVGLPGLGGLTGGETSGAIAVSRVAPYTVAGHAASGGSVVVRWQLP